MRTDIWKLILTVAGSVITILLTIALWFASQEIGDIKAQNKAQWQEAKAARECLYREMTDLRERVARIEGYHKRESEKP